MSVCFAWWHVSVFVKMGHGSVCVLLRICANVNISMGQSLCGHYV